MVRKAGGVAGGLRRNGLDHAEQIADTMGHLMGEQHGAFFVFDMTDSKMIPSVAEPFFQNLNAEIEMSPASRGSSSRSIVAAIAK